MPAVALRRTQPRYRVATAPAGPLNIALLGFGTIGSTVAELAARSTETPAIRVTGALVRDTARPRRPVTGVELTTDPEALFRGRPDVVVEVLGGIEPARSLVCAALERRIPVVTANKSLIAACGDELLDLAYRCETPILYEASVLAGVPFLGSFGRRPHATAAISFTGIVNGTSNFVLGRMQAGQLDCARALLEAQRLGLAEPDPRHDVSGIDATEKLVVLARHFRLGTFRPSAVETTPITGLRAADLAAASEFGGVVKAVVHAAHDTHHVRAFSGPAFLPASHKLAGIDGSDNAIAVRNGYGDLLYAGPGAGPSATAATILDDVSEAAVARVDHGPARAAAAAVTAPVTAWFVRLTSPSLPGAEEVADLMGAHGIWLRRTADPRPLEGTQASWLLTYACARERLDAALRTLEAASGCEAFSIRALGD